MLNWLPPDDPYDEALDAQVHPADWENPKPKGRYHLVVIGAGTAGLVTAAGAAGLGARVALIERGRMGGDCLNVGCVPSKSVLHSARVAASLREAGAAGIRLEGEPTVDFAEVMRRMRRLRAEISPHDSAHRFRELGVDVYFGSARFIDPKQVEVAGRRLAFKRAVIATGARAARPDLPGSDHERVLTNETVFQLTDLPGRLAVVGGGPIGCEMAQAFARLGARVTLLQRGKRLLPRDDPDAAALVQQGLQADGVEIRCNTTVDRLEHRADQTEVFFQTREDQGSASSNPLAVDAVLLAVGRRPNVAEMGLEQAGIDYDPQRGVVVNDRLQTTQSHVYAAGDVCGQMAFTHAADFMARTVIQNALFLGRRRLSRLTIPWCTYTSPELAQIGLTAQQAAEQGVAIDTYEQSFAANDRSILEDATTGWVRVHVRRGKDRIVGATIVGPRAGDLIGTLSIAMQGRVGLGTMADAIHPYPTQAEAIRKLGDAYRRSRLTPLVARLFKTWLRWTG